MAHSRTFSRHRRHRRVRSRVSGSPTRPRLAVFRSASHISVQLIDDTAQRTMFSASDRDIRSFPRNGKDRSRAIAEAVGELIAQQARKAGIQKVVFDRGGFAYHGRVAALAQGARKAGLEF